MAAKRIMSVGGRVPMGGTRLTGHVVSRLQVIAMDSAGGAHSVKEREHLYRLILRLAAARCLV